MKRKYSHSVLSILVTFLLASTFTVIVTAQKETGNILQGRSGYDPGGNTSPEGCTGCDPEAGGTAPGLGAAASFAVLGATTVTNTGASRIVGDVGVSPGTAVTGLGPGGPGTVSGTIYRGPGSLAAQAQTDALAAYNMLAGQTCDIDLTGQNLGGLTLLPGVYCFDSSAQLTGTLTLNANGDPNAVFIFKIGSTLTTASLSSVNLINGATACNVFFQVGSSATLGTDTTFNGNILANTSITLNTRASLTGRAIALEGAVTLDTNNVTVCNLQPTAATVNIGGRVRTASGDGISMASVRMTDSEGNVRLTYTSSFGYYNFEGIEVGQSVFIEVSSKRYTFDEPSQVISVHDEITTVDFVAN